MSALYRDDYGSLGSLAQGVVGADAHGIQDIRLQTVAAMGHNEKIPSEGGHRIPDAVAAGLWSRVYEQGSLLARCTRQPITTGKALKMPATDERSRAAGSRFGGVRTYWVDEAQTVASSRLLFTMLRLQAKKLLSIIFASDELLADAAALNAYLERMFALDATYQAELAILSGNGTDRPLGILNADATITVAPEPGQSAGTFVLANAKAMLRRSWIAGRRNSVWLVHGDLEPELGTLDPSAFGYGPDGEPRLLGRPVIATEYNPPVGQRGDVVLADLSQYLVAELQPDLLSSVHVAFLTDESCFRFRWRLDAQPAWAGPITPADGGATQSPFVALAARS